MCEFEGWLIVRCWWFRRRLGGFGGILEVVKYLGLGVIMEGGGLGL